MSKDNIGLDSREGIFASCDENSVERWVAAAASVSTIVE